LCNSNKPAIFCLSGHGAEVSKFLRPAKIGDDKHRYFLQELYLLPDAPWLLQLLHADGKPFSPHSRALVILGTLTIDYQSLTKGLKNALLKVIQQNIL